MNEIADRFASLEAKLAETRGSFTFFALFLPEDAADYWDLLVAAPWLGPNKQEAVKYLVNEIKSHLGPQELMNLSRIVVVDPDNPSLQAVTKAIPVEHGRVEVRDRTFFGLPIRQGFIITSKTPEVPVTK